MTAADGRFFSMHVGRPSHRQRVMDSYLSALWLCIEWDFVSRGGRGQNFDASKLFLSFKPGPLGGKGATGRMQLSPPPPIWVGGPQVARTTKVGRQLRRRTWFTPFFFLFRFPSPYRR
jgi:hypothetical protein